MIHYYYAQNDQQLGPFTLEELKSKRIKKSTLVWREGMPDWNNADTIDELKTILISEPPPLPQKGKSQPNETVVIKQFATPKTSTKYDLSYTPQFEAAFIGVVLLVVPIIFILAKDEFFATSQSYEEARTIFSIVSILTRIAVTVWVVEIASRQNRNSTNWGWFAFFFPSITLIIIGQLKKLNLKIEIDGNQPIAQQISFLMRKMDDLFKDKRYLECIKILNKVIELDNQNYEAIKNRALSYYLLGVFDKASIDFNTLIQSEKYLSFAYYYLGNLEIKNNHQDKAIEFWLKAKENGNEDVQTELNLYHNYTGKYLLDSTESTKKINSSSTSQYTQFNITEYGGGYSQIDNKEDIKRLDTKINIYSHGIEIELRRTYKSYRLSIAFYEIDDILFNELNKTFTLLLKDKVSLLFNYDKTKDSYDGFNSLCDKYKEATGNISSVSSTLNLAN